MSTAIIPGPGRADPQAGFTYVLKSTIKLNVGTRYVLKRSDGMNCNVDRRALCAIVRHNQLFSETGERLLYVG